MVKIAFRPNKWELEVSGHAGAGKEGEDIVCSAVSILFYSLAKTLSDHEEMFTQPIEIADEKGNGHIKVKPSPKYEATVQTLFAPILTGYQLLADTYPKYISLS